MSAGRAFSGRQPGGGLRILYLDNDVIVVDKPSGLLTVGTARDKTRTAHYLLNDYVRKGNPKSRERVYVVHRLDRETSGLLVFARSEAAKEFLQGHWDEADKSYYAIVHGEVSAAEGTIRSNLVESAAMRVYATPDSSLGRPAVTGYRVLRVSRGLSLLEVTLQTGRKHQIRVHLADLGHPLLGDDRYGRPDRAPRLALHACALSFPYPAGGKRLSFASEMPAEFERLLGRTVPPKPTMPTPLPEGVAATQRGKPRRKKSRRT